VGTSQWEAIQLPSLGIPYGSICPDGKVKVRPMTTQEEKLLAGPKHILQEKLEDVVEKCIDLGSLKYTDLIMGDWMFLLLCVRNVTFGPDYDIEITCSECGKKYKKLIKIPKDLQVRILEKGVDEEPWEIKLPKCGKTLLVRALRLLDERNIDTYEKETPDPDENPGYTYRLAKHIVAIDGKPVGDKFSEAKSLVGNMLSFDSHTMLGCIKKHECGPSFRVEFDCKRCHNNSKEIMPITAEFFLPGLSNL